MTQTLREVVHSDLLIRKSRFLGRVEPIADREAAQARVAGLRAEHPGAAHVCWALMAGGQSAAVDDGEPSGTAGRPMLEVLRHHDLDGVLATVVRYFGGVKLGAGGLVRAYSSAVSEALNLATLVDRRVLAQATVAVAHADAGRFDNLLRTWAPAHDAVLGQPQYGAEAVFEVWVPAAALAELDGEIALASGGTVRVDASGAERVIDVPRTRA